MIEVGKKYVYKLNNNFKLLLDLKEQYPNSNMFQYDWEKSNLVIEIISHNCANTYYTKFYTLGGDKIYIDPPNDYTCCLLISTLNRAYWKEWIFAEYIREFQTYSKKPNISTEEYNSKCPICGSNGLDLAVSFYCDNNQCVNFRE